MPISVWLGVSGSGAIYIPLFFPPFFLEQCQNDTGTHKHWKTLTWLGWMWGEMYLGEPRWCVKQMCWSRNKEEECILQWRWKWEEWCSGAGEGHSNKSFPDFINLRIVRNPQRTTLLTRLPAGIPLLSFYSHPLIFSHFFPALVAHQHDSFILFFFVSLACWLYKQHYSIPEQESSPPPPTSSHQPPLPLCTHYTMPCTTLSDTLHKDIPGASQQLCLFPPLRSSLRIYITTNPHSLHSSAGHISLSVLCKHRAHVRASTWPATLCVYTCRGMEARRRF